jgi:hypothetical protein
MLRFTSRLPHRCICWCRDVSLDTSLSGSSEMACAERLINGGIAPHAATRVRDCRKPPNLVGNQ